MELKDGRTSWALRLRRATTNPFNGIERDSVDRLRPEEPGPENPFNGIERGEDPPQEELVLARNPFNGIESFSIFAYRNMWVNVA